MIESRRVRIIAPAFSLPLIFRIFAAPTSLRTPALTIDRDMALTISQHAGEFGAWRVARLAPPSSLAPFVGSLFAYEDHATSFQRRRELPDGQATLIFNLGADLGVELRPGAKSVFRAGQSFYSGAGEHFVVTETNGAQTGAQVMLTLLGARQLAGVPLAEFGDAFVDPADALGIAASELSEQLAGANSPEARLAMLRRAIEARLLRSRPLAAFLEHAFTRLNSGAVGIGTLAREIGISRKHLTTTFAREFGITPKMFARVRRFDRARRLRQREPGASAVDIALRCGFADQAHMVRDFREFAGLPPDALRRRELPDSGGFLV